MVRVLAVKEGGVFQEHSSRLEDKGGEQLAVDVVPGAVEPPGGGGGGWGTGRKVGDGFWCAQSRLGEAEQVRR